MHLAECQLTRLHKACDRNLSRGLLSETAPLIGAGIGRFLVRELAKRLNRDYVDFASFFHSPESLRPFNAADCATAVAVACLISDQLNR